MSEEREFIKFNFRRKQLDGNLKAHSFFSDGYEFVYIPSLNISGYGNTQEEAKEMAKVCIKDFAETLFASGEKRAIEEIKNLGWKKDKYFNKFNAPFVDKNGILREFNLSEETKIETSSMAV